MSYNKNFYAGLVSFLGSTLGGIAKISLYDVTSEEMPIIATTDYLTADSKSVRSFIASVLNNSIAIERGYFLNSPITTDYSSIEKISVMLIKNDLNKVEGVFCVSVPCGAFMIMQNIFSSIMNFNSESIDNDFDDGEVAAPAEISLNKISEYVGEIGIDAARFSQDERMEFICDLYDMGIYNLKGAVAKTAEVLQISEQSVYRYLTKIKNARC